MSNHHPQSPLERYAAPDGDRSAAFTVTVPASVRAKLKGLAVEATRLQNAAGRPGVVSVNQLVNDALSDFIARCEEAGSVRARRKR